MRHFITGLEMNVNELHSLINLAGRIKKRPDQYVDALTGKHLALLFEKPSLRTRMSFTVAMHELGGHVIESVSTTRKQEEPIDQIRVLQGYCHVVMIRTFAESVFSEMSRYAKIPIINGLSNLHHPCQILADALTLQENFGSLDNLTLTYIGDANNILNSLLLILPQMGVTVNYCCPEEFSLDQAILHQLPVPDKVHGFSSCGDAVKGSNAIYTDVWASMGFEEEKNYREKVFADFQVNEQLLGRAAGNCIVLHCLPMERGKEISDTLPENSQSRIFNQSENRLHVSKALLLKLLEEEVN